MPLPDELSFLASMFKPQKRTSERMDGATVVLTGATSGVGYEAARRIALGGADLVLVVRDREKGAAVRSELTADHGINVHLIEADFSDLDAVRRAAEQVLADHPRIDVLINNAGLHNTSRQLTKDGYEMVFAVNHIASFLFTRLLLDRLLTSSPARILQISSQGHRFGGLDLSDLDWERRKYRGLQGYGASKTAQLLTVWELAERLEGTGVTVNAMHPGAVATNIGMNNGWLYRSYQRYLLFPLLRRPWISGEAIYYLIAAPEMAQVSGKFFNQTIPERPAPNAQDRELGKKVWAQSEELAGLTGMNHRGSIG